MSAAAAARARVASAAGLPATRKDHLEGIQRLLTRPRKEVVAFLGAGFLAPLGATFGSWKGLLREMVRRAKDEASATMPAKCDELGRAEALLERASSSAEFQRVAQVIEDVIGEEKMNALSVALLALPPQVYDASLPAEAVPPGIVQFRKRIAMLRLLPLTAIVTTNFTIFARYGGAGAGGRGRSGSGAAPTPASPSSADAPKVFSLRENEAASPDVSLLSSRATREALRSLLRNDSAGAEADAGASAVNIDDREVKLLKCLDTGCAPPLWDALDPPVFHAHGTLVRPVFTKLGYRQLLHDGPTFMPFMRTLLTTRTLLYIGFSFADEYHVELRSQCLALLGSKGATDAVDPASPTFGFVSAPSASAEAARSLSAPLGYAVMEVPRADGSEQPLLPEGELLTYYRQHEGLAILPFEVKADPPGSKNLSFEEADAILRTLVEKASLTWRLRESLQGGIHLLFFDRPAPTNFARLAAQLSKLSLKTVDAEAEQRQVELENMRKTYAGLFESARRTAAADYALRKAEYDQLEAAGGEALERFKAGGGAAPKSSFTVPLRLSECWPLPNGGSIDCVFSRSAFLEILQSKAELPARPTAKERFDVEDADDYFEQIEVPSSDPKTVEYKGKSKPKHFSALFTLNGFLGARNKRSFLENTLEIVSFLPAPQRMPVVACGAQLLRNDYERWSAEQRSADVRALGCFSFCSTFGDLSTSLFQIIDRSPPPLPPGLSSSSSPSRPLSAAAAAAAGASTASSRSGPIASSSESAVLARLRLPAVEE